ANIAASPPSTEPDVVPPSVANDTSPVLAQSKLAPGAAAETEADGQRAERLARLKISAERWTVRVVALVGGRIGDFARAVDGTLAAHPRHRISLHRGPAPDPGGRMDSARHPALADRR